MRTYLALTCSALAAGVLLANIHFIGRNPITGLIQRKCENCSQLETSDGFIEVAPNIYRFNYAWRTPWLLKVPLAAFVLHVGDKHWVLVDSGVPEKEYLKLLIDHLRHIVLTDAGDLMLLILTHHHKDHTGGIETVLSAFPTASLVAHADEKPFLLDGISTGTLPSTNRGFRLMAALGLFANKKPAWPADRACFVNGSSGDIHDMVCRKGRQGMWLPGKGLISWTRAMGHAPGSLMLQYGNYILAGDVFGQMRTPWMTRDSLTKPPSVTCYDLDEVRNGIQKLASLQFDRAFPSHDIGKGVSKADIDAWASDLMV